MANISDCDGLGPPLSTSQGDRIARGLFPLCELRQHYLERLQRNGFDAFLPYAQFEEQFCERTADLEIHRQCQIEEAKERISQRIWNLIYRTGGGPEPAPFKSPYLQALREKRDQENGIPEEELWDTFSPPETHFRAQYDPCLKSRALKQLEHSKSEARHWVASDVDKAEFVMHQNFWKKFKDEVAQHGTAMGNEFPVDRKGNCDFFVVASEHYGVTLGSPKTSRNPPATSLCCQNH